MKHGSLFAGIGGFDLGFERAGIETIWQVEIDEYCRKVLARHFPHAQRFSDIRGCGAHNLQPVDVLSGGFPCQDISNAGKRAGIDGERSGLWSEYARIIRELRPRYVVVENVAALLGRGMERVLGDLAACGYDAEWQSIRASDVGAPHRRERIWIVAYPQGGPFIQADQGSTIRGNKSRLDLRGCSCGFAERKSTQILADSKCPEWRPLSKERNEPNRNDAGRQEASGRARERRENVAHTDTSRFGRPNAPDEVNRPAVQRRRTSFDVAGQSGNAGDMANAKSDGRGENINGGARPTRCENWARFFERASMAGNVADADGRRLAMQEESSGSGGLAMRSSEALADASGECGDGERQSGTARLGLPIGRCSSERGEIQEIFRPEANEKLKRSDWWAVEPDVGRVAHGVSARVDRLRGLGNAIVPQIAEWIGKRLMQCE